MSRHTSFLARALTSALLYVIAAGATWLFVGCDSMIQGGIGDSGMVEYSLATSYNMEEEDIRDVQIVCGHPQHIATFLTEEGEQSAQEDDLYTHQLIPADSLNGPASSEGLVVEGDEDSVSVTVALPGHYQLQTLKNGQPFDTILLEFATPVGLELITWYKNTADVEFKKAEGSFTIQVEEGAQASFAVVPLGSHGERLAGALETEVTIDPPWMALEVESVVYVNENGAYTADFARSFLFLEEGDVTVTFFDPISGARESHLFEVSPISRD